MRPTIAASWKFLTLAVSFGPIVLGACVLLLPRFRSLHGTVAEWTILAVLLLLPFVGAFGLIKFMPCSLRVRIASAVAYVLAMAMPALLTAIFIGCSWAGTCF
jgi:hypothetical protein